MITRRDINLWLASFLFLGFVTLPFVLFIGGYIMTMKACIKLPNGTQIGREAYLDLSRPYFIPDYVLREPDGTVIGHEIWPLHLTEKAAYGRSWSDDENLSSDFDFIWTRETGTVKKSEHPALYERLIQDPGDIYYGEPRKMNVNTHWLYDRFMDKHQFVSRSCKMSWVTW